MTSRMTSRWIYIWEICGSFHMWGSARERFRAKAGAGFPKSSRVSEKIGQGGDAVSPPGMSERWLLHTRATHGFLILGYIAAIWFLLGRRPGDNPRGGLSSPIVVAASGVVSHTSVLLYTLVFGTSLHARHRVIGTSPWRWLHLWVFASGALIVSFGLDSGGAAAESPERTIVPPLITGGVPSLVAFIGGYIRWDSILQAVARSVSSYEMAKEMLLFFHTSRTSVNQNPSSLAHFCVTVFDSESRNHARDVYECLQKETAGSSRPTIWIAVGAVVSDLGVGALLIYAIRAFHHEQVWGTRVYVFSAAITVAHTAGLAASIWWNRDAAVRRYRLDDHLMTEGRAVVHSATLPELAVVTVFYASVVTVAALVFLANEDFGGQRRGLVREYGQTLTLVIAHVSALHHDVALEAIGGGCIIANLLLY